MNAAIPIEDSGEGQATGQQGGAVQPTDRQGAAGEPALVVTGASTVPVAAVQMTREELRDLTTTAGIDSLTEAVRREDEE